MLKRLCLLLCLLLVGAPLSGCSSSIKASLDSQFTLSVGQSASIENEPIEIKFIGVTADSRCPIGVQCIRAGDVTCEVEITCNGTSKRVLLTQPTRSGGTDGNVFENYLFDIEVSPYPEAGKQIAKNDYKLSMTCEKAIEATKGSEFSLAIGQTAYIASEPIYIKFIDVTGDSRCPKNVVCIQAGNAACDVEITLNNTSEQVTMNRLGLSEAPGERTFQKYTFAFDVLPYPETGKQIGKSDYRLILTVR